MFVQLVWSFFSGVFFWSLFLESFYEVFFWSLFLESFAEAFFWSFFLESFFKSIFLKSFSKTPERKNKIPQERSESKRKEQIFWSLKSPGRSFFLSLFKFSVQKYILPFMKIYFHRYFHQNI